jgi:hypothetical protein
VDPQAAVALRSKSILHSRRLVSCFTVTLLAVSGHNTKKRESALFLAQVKLGKKEGFSEAMMGLIDGKRKKDHRVQC